MPCCRCVRRLLSLCKEPLVISMASRVSALSAIFLGISLLAEAKSLGRSDFPEDFVFGVSTSAYQYEGATFEDGKTAGVWDTFTHEGTNGGSNGDVTSDGYHRYKSNPNQLGYIYGSRVHHLWGNRKAITILLEDVKLMSDEGFDAFRFSISWPRFLPQGRGQINPKGLEFYNNLINELLDNGIQPYVTINYFDFPQKLEDEYNGWLSSRMVDDFVALAEVCFKEFGDRVKHWITLNEPNNLGEFGYSEGFYAPKHCSIPSRKCKKGNSAVEPYLAVHNMMLAHSEAVKLYRTKYQKAQGGSIGLTVLSYFYWPLTNRTQDIVATQRASDFHIGWIIEPLLSGRYPEVMQNIVGNRLPSFTKFQRKELRNSFDFIGLNHYSTVYVADSDTKTFPATDYSGDVSVTMTGVDDDKNSGKQQVGFGSVPLGFEHLLEYVKQHYGNPPVIITESGYANSDEVPFPRALNDTERVTDFSSYLEHMLNAIRNGSNTSGFFAWTLVDCFEFGMGYEALYGLHYIHLHTSQLNRLPKKSAKWFQKMLLPKQRIFTKNFHPKAASI